MTVMISSAEPEKNSGLYQLKISSDLLENCWMKEEERAFYVHCVKLLLLLHLKCQIF